MVSTHEFASYVETWKQRQEAHPTGIQDGAVPGAAAQVAIDALLQRLYGGGYPPAGTPLYGGVRCNHKPRCAVPAL